jgi:hypothetical protein
MERLIKDFAGSAAAPLRKMMEALMAQIPGLLQRPLLLLAYVALIPVNEHRESLVYLSGKLTIGRFAAQKREQS